GVVRGRGRRPRVRRPQAVVRRRHRGLRGAGRGGGLGRLRGRRGERRGSRRGCGRPLHRRGRAHLERARRPGSPRGARGPRCARARLAFGPVRISPGNVTLAIRERLTPPRGAPYRRPPMRLAAPGHSFASLAEVMAKANEEKSGDRLAGVAAADARERVAAKTVLAELPLRTFVEEPLLAPERDELTRAFLDGLDGD